jgi:YesN/AraC family two-component response regulator
MEKRRAGVERCRELVERAYKTSPDLIITDVTMPKMNGFEAVKHRCTIAGERLL